MISVDELAEVERLAAELLYQSSPRHKYDSIAEREQARKIRERTRTRLAARLLRLDPAFKRKEAEAARRYRARHASDPTYRAKVIAAGRKRQANPAYRARQAELRAGPAYRLRRAARLRERWATDPSYRQRMAAHKRSWRARLKKKKECDNGP